MQNKDIINHYHNNNDNAFITSKEVIIRVDTDNNKQGYKQIKLYHVTEDLENENVIKGNIYIVYPILL